MSKDTEPDRRPGKDGSTGKASHITIELASIVKFGLVLQRFLKVLTVYEFMVEFSSSLESTLISKRVD